MRPYHILKGNKSTTRPIHHLFVDIETAQVPLGGGATEQRLRFGWACYWRRRPDARSDTIIYYRFTTHEGFWRLVESRLYAKVPLYLVSHNVNFDFGVFRIFDVLSAKGYTLKGIYLAGMTAIITFTKGQKRLILLDNGNYFKGSLANLGAAIGYEKMDVDPLTANDAELDPYCRRDVEILLKSWQFLYRFGAMHDLGHWGRTLPSQAFNAYRHRFMPCAIHIHNDQTALDLERGAYHGGRTSVFYQGTLAKGPYYKLDVNSMYPFVMIEHEYPRIKHTVKNHVTVRQLREYMRRFQCIARVTVTTPDPVYPIIVKGKMIHPVGTFQTTLTTPELSYALARGCVKSVSSVARYQGAPLFQSYVDFFYKLKLEYKKQGEGPFYHMVKLFLNSLYGKWGQRASRMVEFDEPPPYMKHGDYWVNHETGKRERIYRFGDTWYRQERGGEAYHSFPAIAAHVTAYARMYLWDLITKAGKEHVFYVDTDSLIVDSCGYERLGDMLHPSRLGALKVEETMDVCQVLAPKCYATPKTTRRKGVPRKAKKVGKDKWEFDAFPSFRQQSSWEPGTPYHTQRVTRTLSYRILDGTPLPSGWIMPLDAQSLPECNPLSDEVLGRVWELEAQRDALRESVLLNSKTVFSLWDWKKGGWKHARNSGGEIVPQEYSRWDSTATELGFDDLDALQRACTTTRSTWAQVRTLDRTIHALLHPLPRTYDREPLPW